MGGGGVDPVEEPLGGKTQRDRTAINNIGAEMSTPITDKAEVSIDFPDKFYVGSFGRGSRFDLTADREGVHLHLERTEGEKRRVGFHIHYYLLADLLEAAAIAVADMKDIEPHQLARLKEAAAAWRKLDSLRIRKTSP
jgi:hypothetical protein